MNNTYAIAIDFLMNIRGYKLDINCTIKVNYTVYKMLNNNSNFIDNN